MPVPFDLFKSAADRPVLSFDVDDLLAHQAEALLTVLNYEDGGDRAYADMTDRDAVELWPQLNKVVKRWRKTPASYINLIPYPDAVVFGRLVAEAGFTIIIATKRKPVNADVTEEWLDRVEFPKPSALFFGKQSKLQAVEFAKDAGLPLLHFDDNPDNQAVMQAFPNVTVMIPDRPWTQGVENTFDSWSVILKKLGQPEHLVNLDQEASGA